MCCSLEHIINDRYILLTIQGMKIDFENDFPDQVREPKQIRFSDRENDLISEIIEEFIDRKII